MRDAIEKLVNDHVKLAAEYEAVGDAESAAKLRAVANMVAMLLYGRDAGTLLPSLTSADQKAIKAKEQRVARLEAEFGEQYPEPVDGDTDYSIAHFEAARRTINLVVRKPSAAPLKAWLKGLQDAVEFVITDAGGVK